MGDSPCQVTPASRQEDCKVGILMNALAERQEKTNHRDTENTEMP